jgi:hypothetical protein
MAVNVPELMPPPVRRTLRRVRIRLGDHPLFLPVILAMTPQRLSRTLTASTELVVEGFPRCGNTFAVAAIALAQPREIVISSHVHVPAQVKLAVARHVPTLVVIRDPLDAVASLLVAAPHVRPAAALREFEHHYMELLPWRYGVVVATFEELTADMGVVVDAINARFQTSFTRFEHTADNVAQAFQSVDARFEQVHGHRERALPRPAAVRSTGLAEARRRLDAPELEADVAAAQAVYRRFTAPD